MFLCHSCFVFRHIFSPKDRTGLPSEFQTVRTQIRPDTLLDLVWVQTFLQLLSVEDYCRQSQANDLGERKTKQFHFSNTCADSLGVGQGAGPP